MISGNAFHWKWKKTQLKMASAIGPLLAQITGMSGDRPGFRVWIFGVLVSFLFPFCFSWFQLQPEAGFHPIGRMTAAVLGCRRRCREGGSWLQARAFFPRGPNVPPSFIQYLRLAVPCASPIPGAGQAEGTQTDKTPSPHGACILVRGERHK